MSATDLHWFKSSYSDSGEPGDCVEVAVTPATIHIRDSKIPQAARLTVARTTWTAFLTHVSR
ncbi:DUF397 domain-containing protein [Streptomyces sp. NPDC001260]|uniref:DUF397 domain-containing protein n=1 Tax=Streptomyces sp. NPDC001260 TaxID=3364551 RepID=UPI00368319D4